MLKLRSRTLLNNGISIVDVEYLAERIIKTGFPPEHLKTISCPDTEKFKQKYGMELSADAKDSIIEPKISISHNEQIETISKILDSPRHNKESIEANSRLDHELNFFYESNNVEFLSVLNRLIMKFKEDNVVWGCGRGSSCASYVLYLLEVHDVDPIKYKIEFNEFSKEDKGD